VHLRFYEGVSKKELFGRWFDGAFFCGVFCRSSLFYAWQHGRSIHCFVRFAGVRRGHFVFKGQKIGMRDSQPNTSLEPTVDSAFGLAGSHRFASPQFGGGSAFIR
jgi:hypothetical protein